LGNLENSWADTTTLPATALLKSLCEAEIERLRQRPTWWRVPRPALPALVAAVVAEVQQRHSRSPHLPIPRLIQHSALFCYSEAWYRACRTDGTLAQHDAFAALHRYVNAYVPRHLRLRGNDPASRDPAFTALVRQETLTRIWQSLDSVRSPGAFVVWVQLVAHSTTRDLLAQEGKDAVAHSIALDDETLEADVAIPPHFFQNPALAAQVRRLFARCLAHPLRQMIVEAYYLAELNIAAIADLLQIKPSTVSDQKFLALNVLRRCPPLLTFLEDQL
jgi:RNA polymerase sigma factor (sigma-70 family)